MMIVRGFYIQESVSPSYWCGSEVHKMATIVLYFVLLISSSFGLQLEDLYSFGDEVGDERLEIGDDVSSASISLQVPLTFYEQQFSNIYVSKACL